MLGSPWPGLIQLVRLEMPAGARATSLIQPCVWPAGPELTIWFTQLALCWAPPGPGPFRAPLLGTAGSRADLLIQRVAVVLALWWAPGPG